MSLRWKTLFFLGVLLFTLSTLFVVREQMALSRQYRLLRDEILERQVHLAEEAIFQSLGKLKSRATLVASRPDVRSALARTPGRSADTFPSEEFGDFWSTLQLDSHIALFALYDARGELRHALDEQGRSTAAFLSLPELTLRAQAAQRSEQPQTFAACLPDCALFVWVPILSGPRALGSVMLSLPLSHVLLAFYRVSHANSALALSATASISEKTRRLDSGEPLAAMTGGEAAWRVLSLLQPTWQSSGDIADWQDVRVDEHDYEVSRWPVKVAEQRLPASFLMLNDVTPVRDNLRSALISNIRGGAAFFLLALLAAWLMMRAPLRRLQRIGKTIDALGEKNYLQARQVLSNERNMAIWSDEIDHISHIVRTVALRLERMERASSRYQTRLHAMVSDLQQQQTLINELLQTTPFSIIVHDQSGQIHLGNRLAASLAGCTGDLLALSPFVSTFFTEADSDSVQALLDGLCRDGQSRHHETRFPTSDAQTRVLSWNHCRMTIKGRPLLILSMAQDVTERKESEAELERYRRQLQQAHKMQAIGQLTGGIAHDFNNILASILGYTGLALNQSRHADNPRLTRYLNEVNVAGKRAQDLVAQMLAFSRGGGTCLREPLRLFPLVKEILRLLQPILPERLSLHTALEEVPEVWANAVQVQQILMNLVINARDALTSTGSITVRLSHPAPISAGCSSCAATFSGDRILLSVEDDGPGISAEHLGRIFDPFFTTKDVGKGTGLGLSIVHGLVHDMHGHLQVTSSPHTGTTVAIYLPLFQHDNALPSATQPPLSQHTPATEGIAAAQPLSGLRLWVMSDDVSMADFLGDMLIGEGIQVTWDTADTLLRPPPSAQEPAFDLLLADLGRHPETAGQVLHQAALRWPNLPVILLLDPESNLASLSLSPESADRLPAYRILQKPFRLDSLKVVMADSLVPPRRCS